MFQSDMNTFGNVSIESQNEEEGRRGTSVGKRVEVSVKCTAPHSLLLAGDSRRCSSASLWTPLCFGCIQKFPACCMFQKSPSNQDSASSVLTDRRRAVSEKWNIMRHAWVDVIKALRGTFKEIVLIYW